MRILLLGEYSNVHHTLCEALRRAGHKVLLISDGDGWKNYPRDVDLRRYLPGPLGSLIYLCRIAMLLPRMRGFDVVQLINPQILYLKPRWNRWLFDYLKRHNRIVSLGCFGDDSYVVSRMQQPDFLAYTDFVAGDHVIDHPLNRQRIRTWCDPERRAMTEHAVTQADCLMACLYEYYKVYEQEGFGAKLHYLPLPIEPLEGKKEKGTGQEGKKEKGEGKNRESSAVRVLLAVQKQRGAMKGTDQIEPLLLRLAQEYPDQIDLHRIESVPFEQYCQEVDAADVIVDQLYSYTPAMTALEAMRRGKVVITGGERYELEGEWYEAPVINLRPFADEENYQKLRETLLDRNKIARLSRDSQAYVEKYHDADSVASLFTRLVQMILP